MVAVVSIQRVKKLINVAADSLKVYELFVVYFSASNFRIL